MHALSADTIGSGLSSDHPRVVEHAIRLVETLPQPTEAIATKLASLVTKNSDARVRYQLAMTYGAVPKLFRWPVPVAQLLQLAGDDRWLRTATLTLTRDLAPILLSDTLRSAEVTFARTPEGRVMVADLARQVGTKNDAASVAIVLGLAVEHPEFAAEVLVGLSDGLTLSGGSLHERIVNQPEAKKALDEMLVAARREAMDDKTEVAKRVAAVRLLPIGAFAESHAALTKAIAESQPQEVQLAALSALDRFATPEVGAMLTKAWPSMTPAVRAAAGNVIFARPERAAAFLDAVEAGKIKPADIDRARLQGLATTGEGALRERAKKLLEAAPSAARQQVYDSYVPALSLQGNAANGKVIFEKTCAGCHRINDVGQEIGPNLAAMKSRGAEAILLNVIDPNREVNPQFLDYLVQTKSGRTSSGLLASETASGITLKRAGGETETIARSDIKRMRSSGLSIMPEGLETGIDQQAMADLIAYVLSAK
jgi:putative heme-binding domain-containing protein